jgi:hypothetical protein
MDLNEPADLNPDGKLKMIPTPPPSSPNTGPTLNDTETSAPLILPGLSQWISSAADIPASHFPLPASAAEKPTPDIFGPICSESFARFDPDSSSWRMSQDTFQWDSDKFSETWPSAGTMRNGACYLRPEWERPTSADDCLLWPTPNVAGGGNGIHHLTQRGKQFFRPSGKKAHLALDQAAQMWPTPRANKHSGKSREDFSPALHEVIGGQLNPTWVEWLMGFPFGWTALSASETPSSRKSRKRSEK